MSQVRKEEGRAGVAIMEIPGDIVDAREWDDAKARSQVASWIETLLL